MLSVSDARTRILSYFEPVEHSYQPLASLSERVLAANITAATDLPPFNNSSVDGFAVRSKDVTGSGIDTPVSLKVVADIRAGMYSDLPIKAGRCARIMTGAPLPPQADAVVMVEDTDFDMRLPGTPAPETVLIHKALQEGENVRPRGNDLRAGQVVLLPGTKLRAQELGLLAMLGEAQVPVYRKPRVALLSSGDELVPVDVPLSPGKIHDLNSYVLASLCQGMGADLISLGVAEDTESDVRVRLHIALEQHVDIIISSAGVSVGAFDYLKTVIESEGRLDFWKVNMRPGKPLAFGSFHEIPFFGLPGNPVAAFIGFEVFVRPAIEKLSGLTPRPHPSRKAFLEEAIESDGRESYLRAIVSGDADHLSVRLTGHQGSGNILSLVQANALLIVPSEVKSLPAGSEVDIWLIK